MKKKNLLYFYYYRIELLSKEYRRKFDLFREVFFSGDGGNIFLFFIVLFFRMVVKFMNFFLFCILLKYEVFRIFLILINCNNNERG